MRSETRTRAWALLASLLLGAPGALAGPRSAPGATGAAHTLGTLEERLHTYRDHLERTSRRVTLQEALALGLAQNPSLAKAYAVIASSDWNGVAIRREWMPSLTAGNNDPGLVGVQQQQANTLSISSPELTLEWTFFDPSRHPRAQANAASLAADRFLFDVQARSLVLTIQQQYIDLQTLLELEGQYRQLSTLVEEWRSLAKAEGRRGASTPDVEQLTSQALALLILRIDTHEQVIVAASNLARSLSLPPGDLVMPRDPMVLSGPWGLSRRDTIAQALQFREEIQQSLANARALSWSAVATRAGYRPTLSLEGSGSVEGNSENTDLQSEATVGVNVGWTLFDGGLLAAKARSQRNQEEQALQQAALDRLTVTAEVETSHAAYLNSQIVVDASQAQVQSARATVASATRGFALGTSDATTLLQVLGNLRGAVEAYSRALQKHNRSVAALYRYSARWPEMAPPLVQERLSTLQTSGPPQSPPGR
jgi:outer membrane protein TolC